MRIIDADKFLTYLIFSKHIDGLTCGEVKEAIEMSKIDVFNKIKAEIERMDYLSIEDGSDGYDHYIDKYDVLKIINKYKIESDDEHMTSDELAELFTESEE